MIFMAYVASWVFYNNNKMSKEAEPFIYSNIKDIPQRKVGLLLGTAKYLKGGYKNYFYSYRIDAAVKLYKRKKIKKIIVSGDNSSKRYDETTSMQEDLIKRGVAKNDIFLDYAGFRTLDSIVRAEAIFSVKDYVIITQKFHAQRAIFISHKKGHKSVAFIAKDIANTPTALKMKIRELFARAKAYIDIYFLKTEPKFYGKKIDL